MAHPDRKLNPINYFAKLIAFESLVVFIWLLIIPNGDQPEGFSISQLIGIGVFLFVSILSFWLSKNTQVQRVIKFEEYLTKWLQINHNSLHSIIILTILITLFLGLLLFGYLSPDSTAFFVRIQPILIFSVLLFLHSIHLIKLKTQAILWEKTRSQHRDFITHFILGLVLSIILLLIFIQENGIVYITFWGRQFKLHDQVLNGTAKNPWVFRILSAYITQGVIEFISLIREWRAVGFSFIIVRTLQTTTIFLLVPIYFKYFNIQKKQIIYLANILIAWAMANGHYDSDLSFNVYFDIIFFLLGGIAILNNKPKWIILISILAALNRETGIFIPILLISTSLYQWKRTRSFNKDFYIGLFALGIFLVINLGIRIYILLTFHSALFDAPQGHYLGLDLFMFNITFPISWLNLFNSYNLIPILGLISLKKSPWQIRVFFWSVVPIWIIIHSFYGVYAETRLFLVPYVLILLPAALTQISGTDQTQIPNQP